MKKDNENQNNFEFIIFHNFIRKYSLEVPSFTIRLEVPSAGCNHINRFAGRAPTFLFQQPLLAARQEISVYFLLPVRAETVVPAQAYIPLQVSS